MGTSELQMERIEVYYNQAQGLSPEAKARGERLVSGGEREKFHSSLGSCEIDSFEIQLEPNTYFRCCEHNKASVSNKGKGFEAHIDGGKAETKFRLWTL